MPIPLFLWVYKVLEKILAEEQKLGINSVNWFLVQVKVVVIKLKKEGTQKHFIFIKICRSFTWGGVSGRILHKIAQYLFFKLISRTGIQSILSEKLAVTKLTTLTNNQINIIMSRSHKDNKSKVSEDFLYQELVKVQKLTENLAILFKERGREKYSSRDYQRRSPERNNPKQRYRC